MSRKKLDLSNALIPRGRQAPVATAPVAEMPMILTLPELAPNPDNPRTTRNPKFDEIKESIRQRGLDTVPKVTLNPDGTPGVYIFSDGGNTRYEILWELWNETQDQRFYRIHVLFKPWPGRLHCVIGHLVEGDLHGELTFIDKALGVQNTRTLYEELRGKSVSQRELAALLTNDGYPVDHSSISRMENTVRYLYPWMPELLKSGLGRPQIHGLLAIRNDAEKVWNEHHSQAVTAIFDNVFGECCRKFNSPDMWSLDMFRDELIGELLQAMPHPSLNFDRWLLELDPKQRNQRKLFGDPAPVPDYIRDAGTTIPPDKGHSAGRQTAKLGSRPLKETPEPLTENGSARLIPPSFPAEKSGNTTVADQTETGINSITSDVTCSEEQLALFSDRTADDCAVAPAQTDVGLPATDAASAPPMTSLLFAATGLEPVHDIWEINPLQDDADHLAGSAYRLAFELAEHMGCESEISPSASGYRLASGQTASSFTALLLSLSGERVTDISPSMLADVLVGGALASELPAFNDPETVKFMRLIRVMRRLRELQRELAVKPEEAGNT